MTRLEIAVAFLVAGNQKESDVLDLARSIMGNDGPSQNQEAEDTGCFTDARTLISGALVLAQAIVEMDECFDRARSGAMLKAEMEETGDF